jgi:hypothetical protein
LSVIGELLSIVSLVCSFSADAALNWAPSDSK